MKTFNEWMQIRSPYEKQENWVLTTDETEEDARKFLEEQGPNLFRSFEIKDVFQVEGKTIVGLKGDPQVTLFELENVGILPHE